MRTSSDLRALQSLPYEVKIDYAIAKIHEAFAWAKERGLTPCVSVSGLDSTVLLHLVRSLYPDTLCLFVNTGMEYPEIIAHAKYLGARIITPRKRFHQVVREYGYRRIAPRRSARSIRLGWGRLTRAKYPRTKA
jgi:3'-phosphoadenosine 5'-phosphosulfate sulfotransferase (PAPS reductase)/FAD synthetase